MDCHRFCGLRCSWSSSLGRCRHYADYCATFIRWFLFVCLFVVVFFVCLFCFFHTTGHRGGDVAQLVKRRTGTPLTQVRFPSAARDFSPGVNFQCRLSYGVCTPPCAIAWINIRAHVKDPLVHVRVRWTVETLKCPACTVGCVAQLCRSWFSPGKATRIFYGRNPSEAIQL